MNNDEKRELERADRLKRAKDLIGEMEKELAQHKSPKTVLVQMRKSALTDPFAGRSIELPARAAACRPESPETLRGGAARGRCRNPACA